MAFRLFGAADVFCKIDRIIREWEKGLGLSLSFFLIFVTLRDDVFFGELSPSVFIFSQINDWGPLAADWCCVGNRNAHGVHGHPGFMFDH